MRRGHFRSVLAPLVHGLPLPVVPCRLVHEYPADVVHLCSGEAGLKHIDEPCRGELARTPYAEIEPQLTDEFISRLRVVESLEVPKAVELNASVLISKAYFGASFRTNVCCTLLYVSAVECNWLIVLLGGLVPRITDASRIWVRVLSLGCCDTNPDLYHPVLPRIGSGVVYC